MGITHEISAAFSPQSNGEAESVVKCVKMAISHAKTDNVKALEAAIWSINWEQRLDLSGCSAEVFLNRSLHVPGLAHIPSYNLDVDL